MRPHEAKKKKEKRRPPTCSFCALKMRVLFSAAAVAAVEAVRNARDRRAAAAVGRRRCRLFCSHRTPDIVAAWTAATKTGNIHGRRRRARFQRPHFCHRRWRRSHAARRACVRARARTCAQPRASLFMRASDARLSLEALIHGDDGGHSFSLA